MNLNLGSGDGKSSELNEGLGKFGKVVGCARGAIDSASRDGKPGA